jgi:hypothetical protein
MSLALSTLRNYTNMELQQVKQTIMCIITDLHDKMNGHIVGTRKEIVSISFKMYSKSKTLVV